MPIPLLTIQDIADIYALKSRQHAHKLVDKWGLVPDYVAVKGTLRLFKQETIKRDIETSYPRESQERLLAALAEVMAALSCSNAAKTSSPL